MKAPKIDAAVISRLVKHYEANRPKLQTFLESLQPILVNSKELGAHVHSFKWRLKDPQNLRDKLRRKARQADGKHKVFDVTTDNLFVRINDLVGVRILHLQTRQVGSINQILKELLAEARLKIVEGPFARTWDDETKSYFKEIGIKTRESGPSMYTSVHYIIDSASRTRFTAEIQVRTLAEELWGEVAHVIDYPTPCKDLACQEQIRVLARVTSSCTRLVDAIFKTYQNSRSRRRSSSVNHK